MIDPAIETLFDGDRSGPEVERNGDEQAPPLHWSSYWYRGVVPHMQSLRLSATIGFNRIALMFRLMSPVQEPKLKQLLPEEVVTTKVSEKSCVQGSVSPSL